MRRANDEEKKEQQEERRKEKKAAKAKGKAKAKEKKGRRKRKGGRREKMKADAFVKRWWAARLAKKEKDEGKDQSGGGSLPSEVQDEKATKESSRDAECPREIQKSVNPCEVPHLAAKNRLSVGAERVGKRVSESATLNRDKGRPAKGEAKAVRKSRKRKETKAHQQEARADAFVRRWCASRERKKAGGTLPEERAGDGVISA